MASNDNIQEALVEALAQYEYPAIDPRSIPARFSRLKLMSHSPAHYFDSVQRGDDSGSSLEYKLGSGVHAIVLGTPVCVYPGIRRGAKWDAFEAEHAGETILITSEWLAAKEMASAIMLHKEAMRIMFASDSVIEQRIDWTYLGRSFRSTPDSWSAGSGWVVDLKTARTSQPAAFMRDAIRMHYHAQLACYSLAIAHGGTKISGAYIVAVEKSRPHPVTVFRLTDELLDLGARTLRLWAEQLLACESANHWPGYTDAIVDFDLPAANGMEIEIDGKLVELSA
jgi:hypothetical protein